MLSKKHRFTRQEFERLRPKMKKFGAGDFLFFYCPLQRESKLAAVISKKVNKRAVARNAWRRRVYRVMGPKLLKSVTPLAVVCLYKGAFIPENNQDLLTAWNQFADYAERQQLLKY